MKYVVGDLVRVHFPAFKNPYAIVVDTNAIWNDSSKFMYHVVAQTNPGKVLYLYENQLFLDEEQL